MTKIFVTRRIPNEGLSMLKNRKAIKLDVYEKDQVIPRKELLRRVKGTDIIVSILTEKIDVEVMDAAGASLKMIANYAVGFDNIDLKEAAKRHIIVTNAAAAEVSETVAEHAAALILGIAHRVVETDQFTRDGKYKNWGPELLLGTDVYGKTLGIIGAGRIGFALAKRMANGFGMHIVYHNRERHKELEKEFSAEFLSLRQLLKRSDFVSLHVPLLLSTRHLISTSELKLMKKTAYLINTARGPVIDEAALEKALAHKQIAGAGLDVYECEPLIDCNPNDTFDLRKLDNVILTPHTASATIEARQAMSRTVAENVLAYLDHKIIPNLVK